MLLGFATGQTQLEARGQWSQRSHQLPQNFQDTEHAREGWKGDVDGQTDIPHKLLEFSRYTILLSEKR